MCMSTLFLRVWALSHGSQPGPLAKVPKKKERKIRLCRITHRIGNNAYQVQVPFDVQTSNICSVADLLLCIGDGLATQALKLCTFMSSMSFSQLEFDEDLKFNSTILPVLFEGFKRVHKN